MKIGIRGHDFGRHSITKLISLYRQYDIQTIQLAIPKAIAGIESYHDADDAVLHELGAALRQAEISVSVLGCYVDPALECASRRKQEVEVFRQGIRCAAALNAGCIGTETTMFGEDESRRPLAFDRLCSSLELMLESARDAGVTVAVEPVTVHTLNSPSLVAELLQRFDGAPLALILDPVNLLKPDETAEQQTLWRECLEVFGEHIMALHVKDVLLRDGKLVSCLLGEGEMRYEPVLMPWLRENKSDLPLLREEILIETAKQDIDWMKQTFIN